MTKKLLPTSVLCASLILLLAGCSGSQGYGFFPGVHKISIQQGSKITQEMVDQLKPGMTKAQVRYVLGTPLIADTFDQDRWDYYYVLTRGDGSEVKEHLSVFFVEDQLESFEGDFIPSPEPDPEPIAEPSENQVSNSNEAS